MERELLHLAEIRAAVDRLVAKIRTEPEAGALDFYKEFGAEVHDITVQIQQLHSQEDTATAEQLLEKPQQDTTWQYIQIRTAVLASLTEEELITLLDWTLEYSARDDGFTSYQDKKNQALIIYKRIIELYDSADQDFTFPSAWQTFYTAWEGFFTGLHHGPVAWGTQSMPLPQRSLINGCNQQIFEEMSASLDAAFALLEA